MSGCYYNYPHTGIYCRFYARNRILKNNALSRFNPKFVGCYKVNLRIGLATADHGGVGNHAKILFQPSGLKRKFNIFGRCRCGQSNRDALPGNVLQELGQANNRFDMRTVHFPINFFLFVTKRTNFPFRKQIAKERNTNLFICGTKIFDELFTRNIQPMFPAKFNPSLKMPNVVVNKHAIHIEN